MVSGRSNAQNPLWSGFCAFVVSPEKEAAAGGEPAAEKGGRVLMVIRFCSKEEVLGGSVMPPLGVGGRTEICSLWFCICQPPWADVLERQLG